MPDKQKLLYLIRSILNFKQERVCPYCNNKTLTTVDQKYWFTQLLSCSQCGLYHRHPKDKESWLKHFYQTDYKVDNLMMTSLPSETELSDLKNNGFEGFRDYAPYIEALLKNRRPLQILDYGCSWGYNVKKLLDSGYQATGFEVSRPRADFGKRELKVAIITNEEDLPKRRYDLIMSSHVIEHLSSIADFLITCKACLKEDGLLVTFCPNGSMAYRKREPEVFHVNWGLVHPNYLSTDFAAHVFQSNPYLILTGDWEFDLSLLGRWDGKSQIVGDVLDGKELLIVAKPSVKA